MNLRATEDDGCPVCSGLDVVRYEGGQAPAGKPFCVACHRRLAAVEVGADERRRLAATSPATYGPAAKLTHEVRAPKDEELEDVRGAARAAQEPKP